MKKRTRWYHFYILTCNVQFKYLINYFIFSLDLCCLCREVLPIDCKEWELWTKCVNDTTLSGDRWYCSSIYSDLGPRWWTLGHRYFIRWYTQNISKTANFWFFLTFHFQIRAIPNCRYLHISWEINNRNSSNIMFCCL